MLGLVAAQLKFKAQTNDYGHGKPIWVDVSSVDCVKHVTYCVYL